MQMEAQVYNIHSRLWLSTFCEYFSLSSQETKSDDNTLKTQKYVLWECKKFEIPYYKVFIF